ncbi:MAG: hotdog fold thioesterase [Gammaproteobacteria bacterium]|nr:hotdog fold thioesterase [Gammaproteobacteria bacterium]
MSVHKKSDGSIWTIRPEIAAINGLKMETLYSTLDIQVSEVGDDYIKATMPVVGKTHQFFGNLHGGASVVLAETLGSLASYFCLDQATQYCVGLEVNANHLRGKTNGVVTATARPLHLGKRTHVWDIPITDEQDRLVCIARLTIAILDRSPEVPVNIF